jgi:hypothetical protein
MNHQRICSQSQFSLWPYWRGGHADFPSSRIGENGLSSGVILDGFCVRYEALHFCFLLLFMGGSWAE